MRRVSLLVLAPMLLLAAPPAARAGDCRPDSKLGECLQPIADAANGVVIGGHRVALGGEIGRGMASVVYEATDLDGGARWVVKVRRDPKIDPKYAQECGLLATLAGAGGMPACGGVGAVGADPAILLERVPGRQLDQSWGYAERPRPGGKAVRIALRMLGELAQMHARGIVHGDVRGKNTMILDRRSDTVRLVDAGLSGPASADGIATDVRDAAMVLEQLVSESDGVRDQSWVGSDVLRAGIAGLPPAMKPLAPVFQRAFDPDRRKRFHTAAELSAALAPFATLPDPK